MLGVGGCLVLFFAMRQAVGLQSEIAEHPVARSIQAEFSHRLASRPIFAVEQRDGVGRAVLTIEPKLPVAGSRLARILGSRVWAEMGPGDDWDTLEVLVRDGERSTTYRIPSLAKLGAEGRSRVKR